MKKRDFAVLAVGMVLGAALICGANAATGVLAQPAWSPIFVDGQQVQMTAYNILGNNYVKLRDIGQAVGFNVYYQGGVQVDSDAPYTGTAPVSQPAAEEIRVSSYKGNTLTTGDGSGLMIFPAGLNYTLASSNPSVASVEQVLNQWTVNANAAGTAVITATAPDGRTGSFTITVTAAVPAATSDKQEVDLSANMDIRLEMVRLINQVRRENGVAELPVNEALMNAAQDCSAQMFTDHNSEYECRAAKRYGYPYGFGDNLTWFTGFANLENAAETAVNNWRNSTYHFQTMIDPSSDTIGVGITIRNGKACCYMFTGVPNSYSAYD